jgi:hypothetical protein
LQDTENISGFLSVNLLESKEKKKKLNSKNNLSPFSFQEFWSGHAFDKVKIVMLNENANGMNLMRMHVLSVKSE